MKSFFGKALEVANAAAIINACFLLGIIIFVLIGISPLVGNITRHMQEARYHSPIDDLSSEAKLAKVSEAIKVATSNGKFWDSIPTMEENYKGLYSEKNPPPYWRFIEEDYALGKKLGLVRLEKLPDYGSLTRSERLMLCHPDDYGSRIDLVRSIINSFASTSLNAGSWPNNTFVDYAASHLPESFVLGSEKLTTDQAIEWLKEQEPRLHLSPLTSGFIRYDCNTFSPGNAYAEYYYGDDEWARLMSTFVLLAEEYSPRQAQRRGFMYYRIYGEKGIIAEGLRPEHFGFWHTLDEGEVAPLVIRPHE